MSRFYKVFVLTVILVTAIILAGAQVVKFLRDAATPPALPYGLAMLDVVMPLESMATPKKLS